MQCKMPNKMLINILKFIAQSSTVIIFIITCMLCYHANIKTVIMCK